MIYSTDQLRLWEGADMIERVKLLNDAGLLRQSESINSDTMLVMQSFGVQPETLSGYGDFTPITVSCHTVLTNANLERNK